MTVDIFPAGIQSSGNNRAILLTTPPAIPSKPKLAELTAGLDATCYFMADFWDQLDWDQDRDDDTRACDTSKREDFGLVSIGTKTISHIVNPQGDGTEPGNLLAAAIQPDSQFWLYLRTGIPQTDPIADGQTISVGYHVATGEAMTLPRSSGKYLRKAQTNFSLLLTDYKIAA